MTDPQNQGKDTVASNPMGDDLDRNRLRAYAESSEYTTSSITIYTDIRRMAVELLRRRRTDETSEQQRLADCEMSLRVFDPGNTSEYWLRYPHQKAEVQRHSRNCDCTSCHYSKKFPQVKPHHATCGCFECAPAQKASEQCVDPYCCLPRDHKGDHDDTPTQDMCESQT